MKVIRDSSEDEMILEFLKGELSSVRFHEKLNSVLEELRLDSSIITHGNLLSDDENISRKKVMKYFRGYPDQELFFHFPKIYQWKYVEFSGEDINHIFYINYDYWNELSNNTSMPTEAAKNVIQGVSVFGVSNQSYLDGAKNAFSHDFPPIILITCNDSKFLLIEGHSRATIYGMVPESFDKTYGYVGYCTEDDMKLYDERMIN